MDTKNLKEVDPTKGRAASQLKVLKRLAKSKEVTSDKHASCELVLSADTFKLDWTNITVTKEEVFVEYINFLRSLPVFIKNEREKIVRTVQTNLKMEEIEICLPNLQFEKLINTGERSHIVDLLSAKLGQSLRYDRHCF